MSPDFKVEQMYDLGGKKTFIVGYGGDNQNFRYYGFKSNSKIDIVNTIARLHNSQAYLSRENGVDVIHVMNAPNLVIRFM